jgi:ribonuclease HI
VDTHPFFQHLLCNPLTEEECQDFAVEIREKTFAVCSDGACDTSRAKASHGVVFASELLQQQVAVNTGPVDGHPDLVTSYRAELSGIVATLYAADRIYQFHNISAGAMKLYCDNKGDKGALTNAFKPIKHGIMPYFRTDHDMIEVTQSLIRLIPIVITTQWVKGHYSGNNKKYEHKLNEEADRIAGVFQLSQTPNYSIQKPIAPPNFKVHLLFDSSVITSKIKQITRVGIHTAPIAHHIIRKAHWTSNIFESIHWDAHERALRRLPRFCQHTAAKLCHGLVNTNRQNHLYYHQSPMFPICFQEEETMTHVFTCSHPSAASHRQTRLKELYNDLNNASTPIPVVTAVCHRFTVWDSDPTSTNARALTAGSLQGADAVLTSAFREQFSSIGCYHLCLGRISKKWALAVQHYAPTKTHSDDKLHWASIFVAAL